ncbi:hypothetical protein [Branchiibius cervicis]|uniref:GAF domain-containing protein n=1 Tax=Branchiibius cervicis TaxID=908252 RepID=A0ABW2AVU5_9MICO
MSESNSSAGGGWAIQLTIDERLARRRRPWSWLLPLVVVLLPIVGTFLLTLGQGFSNEGDWTAAAIGLLLMSAAGVLQWQMQAADHRLDELEASEADRLRVTVKDALQPLASVIADIPTLTPGKRKERTRGAAQAAVGALILLFRNVERLRAVVYVIDDFDPAVPDARKTMSAVAHQGRGETPRPFETGTNRGDLAFKMIEEARSVFVPDLDLVDPPDYAGTRVGYGTFISAAITGANTGYGMVTVDAPHANDLTGTDREIVILVAHLLAIAYSITDSKP